MILIGLTGGIGSGKSTVSALLRDHGAVVIDGDRVARDLQQPGSPALAEIGERFPGVIADDGSLDRSRLAGIVFSDPDQLAALNRIMLPKIRAEVERQIEEQRESQNVVVLDFPLLAENPRSDLDGVVVVDLPEELAVARLVSTRGMSESDARARIARQATREDRLKIADRVIDNSGDEDDLRSSVDDVWSWMSGLREHGAQR
ncbi:MAG: dephospho-CoA kinase [Ilumatobacteraceae bacterium]